MSIAEKSYAFMVTKSALESEDIPLKTKLQVFRDDTGCTDLVAIMQAHFLQYGLQFIRTAGNFKVLSYHSHHG